MIVDFHSHVLPGIDDGSASVEESLKLLALQASQGVTHAVATPHFYPRHQSAESFFRHRREAQEALSQAMAEKEGLPELIVGAEVHYFSGIGSSELLPELTIGQTPYILVEMPHGTWTDRMYQDLEDISEKQELTPVIAHLDRYLGAFSGTGIAQRLLNAGALIQVNASFFLDPWMSAMAMRMLRKEQIQLLGSDCHNLDSRPPRIGAAIGRISGKLGEDALAYLEGWSKQVLFGA